MRRATIDRLRCPSTGARFDLDPIRTADDEVIEAFLVSSADRSVKPVFAGVAVLVKDLKAHLRAQGDVYRLSSVRDPRMVRFVMGQAGSGHDRVPFEEVIEHYRDLAMDAPEGFSTEPSSEDLALSALASRLSIEGPVLVVGAGVGRNVFVLRTVAGPVIGIDRSLAKVRRSRNIAVTVEHFHLPGPKSLGVREVRLDLECLVRDDVDFAVADPDALPFAADTFSTVLLEARDGSGAFAAEAVAEAERVVAPGGLLLWRTDAAYDASHLAALDTEGLYAAARA